MIEQAQELSHQISLLDHKPSTYYCSLGSFFRDCDRDFGGTKRKKHHSGKSVSVVEIFSSSDDEAEVDSAKKQKTTIARTVRPSSFDPPEAKRNLAERDLFMVSARFQLNQFQ